MFREKLFAICLVFSFSAGCTTSTTDVFPATITQQKEKPPVAVPTSPPLPTKTTSEQPSIALDTPTPITSAPQKRPENAIPYLSPGQSATITYIHMVNATQGWAIGLGEDGADHIMQTEDGGNTWQDVTPPEPAWTAGDDAKHAQAFFLDVESAWVSYKPYEIIWRTTDNGMTWQPSITALAGNLGATFWFTDMHHGWLMKFLDAGMHHTYTALFQTTTGGASWLQVFDPYTSDELQSFSKTGIVFADANTGWVTRDSGGVMPGAFIDVTEDGGFTWQSLQLPAPEDNPNKFDEEYCSMHSPTLFSASSGALVVECKRYDDGNKYTYYMFSTTDGGITWNRFDYPGGKLHFINHDIAYALDRDIYQTSDGGQTWTKVKTVNWAGQFSFVNEDLGWAVATAGEEIALVKTSDGCQTWEELTPQVVASELSHQEPGIGPSITVGTPSLTGGGSGQIAFISYRDNPDIYTSDIYSMNIDGSGLTELTDSSGSIYNFTWSPDGSQIAFDSDRDGDSEIYVINIDGSGMTQLTYNSDRDVEPDWSPDGKKIAFTSSSDGDTAIYVMNTDGSQVQKRANGRTPAWSPDGTQIAFGVFFDGMYVMNADGSNIRRLTDSSEHGYDHYPAWSPDGSQILFASNRHAPGDAATELVYIMNSDGSGIGQLTFKTWGRPPYAWSPDGTLIAYTEGFGPAKLYVMSANGMDQRPLMEDNEGSHPLWRP